MTGRIDDAAFEEVVRTRLSFSSCMRTEIKFNSVCVCALYRYRSVHCWRSTCPCIGMYKHIIFCIVV